MLTTSFISRSDAQALPHVTVNIENKWDSTNSNQNSNTSEMTDMIMDPVKHSLRSFLKTDMSHHYMQLHSYLWQYRYYLCGSVIATTYGIFCYHFYQAKQFMQHQTVWSSWHQGLTLKELLSHDIEKLTQELLVAIQLHYSNKSNPTDFIFPLVEFSTAIQKELDHLNFYERIYSRCKKYYITKIIPFNIQQLEPLSEYIERATYIQNLFKNWAAHHNLRQAQCQQP